MTKQLSTNILRLLFISALAIFFLYSTLNAQNVSASYKFHLELREGEGSIGRLILNLGGGDELHVLDKYEITIPVRNAENFLVRSGDNIEDNFIVTDEGGYKTISITFKTPLSVNENKQISIEFTSPELIISQYGLNHLYIQNPFDNLSRNISYEIEYPKSFGNVYRTYENQKITELDSDTNLIEIESNNGIYILWADNVAVNISTSVNVRNENSTQNSFLFNLPTPTDNQKVFLKDLNGIDDGVSDYFNNLLGEINLDANSSKDVGYSADVLLNNTETVQTYPQSYNLQFNTNSAFGREIIENIQDLATNELKMKMFNQILINKANPNKQAATNYQDFDNIWTKLETDGTINSFEYAALNVSFAEYLNLKGRLDYGYIFSSPVEMDLSRPQVWAVINIDGENVFIDSFMEDLSTISYFDTNYVDRIKFGTWHPNQSYNPAAGLAYESNAIKIEITQVEETQYDNDSFTAEYIFPESAPSGSYFDAEFSIKNSTIQPLILKTLVIDGENAIDKIEKNKGLIPVVFPNGEKKFVVKNLSQEGIFFSGLKDIESKITFQGIEKELVNTSTVSFYIDFRNVVLFVIIFGLSFSIVGFIFIKLKKKLVK